MAVIIFKPTEACNSNCAYCDVVIKQDATKTMTFDLLEILYKRVDEYLKKYECEKIDITIHGGEPLMLGPDFYRMMLKFQDRICQDTKNRINYSIQSNITLITNDYIEVLGDLGIKTIGTSFDPCPNMRGPGAKIDYITYNKLFFKGIDLLRENGFYCGVIYVVTKKSLERPLDIFFYLSNLFPIKSISFNPVLIYDDERKELSVSPGEYADFIGKIFEKWWEHKERYPLTHPFDSFTDFIEKGIVGLGCNDSGGKCAYSHINIDPLGNTSQCGRSSDWGILSYGNILDLSLEEILQDKQREMFSERNNILPETECKGCRFWFMCHGGCPLDAYSKNKSFMHKSEWCDAKRLFIENYFEPITGHRLEQGGRQ